MCLGVEIVVAPELVHDGITGSELVEGEPIHETGTEGDSTLLWVDLDVAKSGIMVGGDDW